MRCNVILLSIDVAIAMRSGLVSAGLKRSAKRVQLVFFYGVVSYLSTRVANTIPSCEFIP